MKAISLWQPWASAVALGCKRIETRHWTTRYRGTIAIHAARRWTSEERDHADDFAVRFDVRLRRPPLGAIVATAQLVDVVGTEQLLAAGIGEMEEALGNYGRGRFGWMFRNIVVLPTPIPCVGRQGLFDIADDLFGVQPAADAPQLL